MAEKVKRTDEGKVVLSKQREAFTYAYIVEKKTREEAYEAAGYKSKSKRGKAVTISKLLNSLDVRARIRELNERKQHYKTMSREELLDRFISEATNMESFPADRVKALTEIGKLEGYYMPKRQINANLNATATEQQVSSLFSAETSKKLHAAHILSLNPAKQVEQSEQLTERQRQSAIVTQRIEAGIARKKAQRLADEGVA